MGETYVATIPAGFGDVDEFDDASGASVQHWVLQAFAAERAPQRARLDAVARPPRAPVAAAQCAAAPVAVRAGYWWMLALALAAWLWQ